MKNRLFLTPMMALLCSTMGYAINTSSKPKPFMHKNVKLKKQNNISSLYSHNMKTHNGNNIKIHYRNNIKKPTINKSAQKRLESMKNREEKIQKSIRDFYNKQ